MPPKKKQGALAKQLDVYLALPNSLADQNKIQEAKGQLISAASKRIDGYIGKLSEKEIKALKEAMNKFVNSKNEALSRRVMQALDKNNWQALRIELVSFSRTKNEHMDRMGIELSGITHYSYLLQVVDRLDPMYQLEIAGPPQMLLDLFINIFYPIISPRRQSEQMARWKMAGYFHLLDAVTPDNCWVLLDELPLFDLSSTSMPSEVKTTDTTKPRLENSTFLTGRADLAIITLAGRNAPIMKDKGMKTKLVESFKVGRPFTYEAILDRVRGLKIARDGVTVRVEGVQFLVIEAKSNTELGGASGKSRSPGNSDESADEEGSAGDGSGVTNEVVDGFVNEVGGSPKYTDEETERETRDENEQGNNGIEDDLEGEGDQGNERGKGDMGSRMMPPNEESDEEGEHCGGEDKSGASEGEDEDDGAGDEDDAVVPLEQILEGALPQIISEAVALSGSVSDGIAKFILSNGDDWIFGLLDCTKEKGGRLCFQTVVRVLKDSEKNEGGLEGGILATMRLLAFWAIVPGAQLKKLFIKK